jgi:excisionase family DNA binding protein
MTTAIEGARQAERAYSIPEAAEVKSLSEATIRRAIHAQVGNVLAAKKVGRHYRIAASELDRWFDDLPEAT